MRNPTTTAWFICLLVQFGVSAAADSELRSALEDELQRNMEGLHIEGLPKPYFIGYTVHEDHSATLTAADGGIESQTIRRSRSLQVDMRVGSPELDNTNFFSNRARNARVSVSLPLEDDDAFIRKQVWIATDRAYHRATEVYATKVAAIQNTVNEDRVHDFSEQPATTFVDKRRSHKLDLKKIRQVTRDLSRLGSEYDFVSDRRLVVFANQHLDTYVNSEGTYFSRVDDTAYLRSTAWTQAEDGRYVSDHVAITGRSWRDVLNASKARREIKEMYERLEALRSASTLERYNGPLLIQGQAAGELIAQSLAPNFLTIKEPAFESNNFAVTFNQVFQGAGFRDKLGARVLPRGWSIYDDPTLKQFKKNKLIGQYGIDSDGVATRRVDIVQKGVLKTLLSDRNPTKDIKQSSGSNATSAGPTVSNLIVEVADGQSKQELEETFKSLIVETGNEFGMRVDYAPNHMVASSMGVPSPFSGRRLGSAFPLTQAFKVYLDGTEELVRNAVVTTPLVPELKNMPGYSEDVTVHNGMYTYQSGDVTVFGNSFPVYVSVVTPDLLIEDVTITNQEGIVRSHPIVPSPRLDN